MKNITACIQQIKVTNLNGSKSTMIIPLLEIIVKVIDFFKKIEKISKGFFLFFLEITTDGELRILRGQFSSAERPVSI